MSRQQISKHYSRLLFRWPVDRLRPAERTLQSVFRARINAPPAPAPNSPATGTPRNELGEINAAYLLLDDTFAKQFPLSDVTMKPASNPTHYSDLKRELDEAPDRTFFANVWNRFSNMFRMK